MLRSSAMFLPKSENYISQGIVSLLNGIVPKWRDSYYVLFWRGHSTAEPKICKRISEMATHYPFEAILRQGKSATNTEGSMQSLYTARGSEMQLQKPILLTWSQCESNSTERRTQAQVLQSEMQGVILW